MDTQARAKAPIVESKNTLDFSHLLTQYLPDNFNEPVSEVEIRPNEQTYMSLGSYDSLHIPKAFAVESSPAPDDAIVARVTGFVSDNGQTGLILHIANCSSATVSGTIWCN